jgi:hypothetical protein
LKARVKKDRYYREAWTKEISGKRKCMEKETQVK